MRSPILLKFDVWVHYRFAEAAADCLILLKFGRLVQHGKMGGFMQRYNDQNSNSRLRPCCPRASKATKGLFGCRWQIIRP